MPGYIDAPPVCNACMHSILKMGVVDTELDALMSLGDGVTAQVNTVHGCLPASFTTKAAEAWKGNVEGAFARMQQQWVQIDEVSGFATWEFDPACGQQAKEGLGVLGRVSDFVGDLRIALLSFCDLRMKLRSTMAATVEFQTLAHLMQKLDAGEKEWGISASPARQFVTDLFERQQVAEKITALITNFRSQGVTWPFSVEATLSREAAQRTHIHSAPSFPSDHRAVGRAIQLDASEWSSAARYTRTSPKPLRLAVPASNIQT